MPGSGLPLFARVANEQEREHVMETRGQYERMIEELRDGL